MLLTIILVLLFIALLVFLIALGGVVWATNERYYLYFIIRLGDGTLLTKRIKIPGDYDYVEEYREAEMFRWMEKILRKYPDSGMIYSEDRKMMMKRISLSTDPEMMFVMSKIEREF